MSTNMLKVKDLKVRRWICPECGSMARDFKAWIAPAFWKISGRRVMLWVCSTVTLPSSILLTIL